MALPCMSFPTNTGKSRGQGNVTTGQMDYWKAFGTDMPAGVAGVEGPYFSRDGRAYAYEYGQVLSQAYVVRGLK